MIPRFLYGNLLKSLARSPAVAILGPRQVGKTTLAKQIVLPLHRDTIYIDLERPSDQRKLEDPELFFRQQVGKLVIVDEIQRLPKLFQTLRGIIDDQRHTPHEYGQFLLLGSASLDVVQGTSESLAGRISYLDLNVLTTLEVGNKNMNALWLRGGFPKSFLSLSDQESIEWREDFISTYLERDIPALGARMPAETLRLLWTMLAHNQGQPTHIAGLASALGIGSATVKHYIHLLIDLLLLRALRPWSGNIGKRLVKTPKLYIRDSGLTHALLKISTANDLVGHPVVGSSWEGFVIENILSILPRHMVPFFYRTADGAEIDLLLEVNPTHRIAIEVKRSLSPTISKGFYTACDTLGIKERYIVYPGDDNFLLPHHIQVISLSEIMKKLSD